MASVPASMLGIVEASISARQWDLNACLGIMPLGDTDGYRYPNLYVSKMNNAAGDRGTYFLSNRGGFMLIGHRQ
jgi:hypothetical protein